MRIRHAIAGIAAAVLCGPGMARAEGRSALSTADIDHMIRAEWNKEGITPASAADDARFLRRAYLDIVGVIPPAETVKAFLVDTSPDKRARAIQSLLESPKYAENWAGYWDTILMGRKRVENAQIVDRTAFKQWLLTEFQQNAHWDKFVYDLISATGVNSAGGSYAKALGMPEPPNGGMAAALAMRRKNQGLAGNANGANPSARRPGGGRVLGTAVTPGAGGSDDKMMAGDKMAAGDAMMSADGAGATTASLPAPLNGATNWILKYRGNPQDLSGTASKLFLGVQIQCAQCHDHKTEKWKQEDFKQFTACFVNARPVPVDPTLTQAQLKGKMRQVNLVETRRPPVRFNPKAKKPNNAADYARSIPAALDGTDFSNSANRRADLAAWMTAPNNPWFAKAIVNRMWNHFLGRGFIEPIDDIRPSNPVVMPELLDKLAADFTAHDYDMKYLIKQICATQVYQLSSGQAKKTDVDNKYWARYRLSPMGPEELIDSLVQATNMGPVLERVAGGRLDQVKFAMSRQFTFLFDVDEEFEQKDFEGTIPQALMLLNGNLVNRGATPIPGTTLSDVLMSGASDKAKIEELYLRTLSRMPTASELARWTEFVHAPRYMSTAPEAVAPQPQPTAPRAGRNGRLANRRAPYMNNNGQTASGNTANGTAPASAADRKALAQALNKKKGNNGYDPLARLGPQATAVSQTPEAQAYEDLLWALLNSSEFIFNH